MFTTRLLRLYRPSIKTTIRNVRSRKRLEYTGPNPGLDNRISAFKEDGIRLNSENVEESIEQSDSDFHNVGNVYEEYIKETTSGKIDVRHHLVKDKYFKEHMPNLLSWSEKEQIRHLANTRPDEWTPEKIAESFPVTVPIVKKLLKYPWKPATEQRIERHDQSAMRNWKELKEGTLNIPKDLKEHFLKFSDRTLPPLNLKSIKKIDVTPDHKIGEFESIIRRCAKNENDQHNSSTDNHNTNFATQDSNKKINRDRKKVTLDELTQKIKKRLEEGNEVKLPDQIIVNTVKSNHEEQLSRSNTSEVELFNDEIKENSLVMQKPESNTNDIMDYPERIRIPKKAYKRYATYKVNDCYYDHDGKFLYRVLGL